MESGTEKDNVGNVCGFFFLCLSMKQLWTSLYYCNVLCGDCVLREKHFPGISNMLDGGR